MPLKLPVSSAVAIALRSRADTRRGYENKNALTQLLELTLHLREYASHACPPHFSNATCRRIIRHSRELSFRLGMKRYRVTSNERGALLLLAL